MDKQLVCTFVKRPWFVGLNFQRSAQPLGDLGSQLYSEWICILWCFLRGCALDGDKIVSHTLRCSGEDGSSQHKRQVQIHISIAGFAQWAVGSVQWAAREIEKAFDRGLACKLLPKGHTSNEATILTALNTHVPRTK